MFKAMQCIARRHLAALGVSSVGCGTLGANWFVSRRAQAEPQITVAAPRARTPAKAAPGPTLLQKCAAEAIGTGIIVQGGCGCVCAANYAGWALGPFGIASVWGGSVALAIYASRDVSGAHLNPAVTAALLVNRPEALPVAHAPAYVAAQMAGATLAGAANYAIFGRAIRAFESAQGIVRGTPASTASYAGAFGMIPNAKVIAGPMGAFAAEAYMTAVFVYLVFTITDPEKSVPTAAAPALIGTAVAALIGTFGPVTGCGMNPARDLGPRLVTAMTGWRGAALASWLPYSVGPVVGAVLGGAAYNAINSREESG